MVCAPSCKIYFEDREGSCSCRESLSVWIVGCERERQNARREYENRAMALKYIQEYAGKVGEKRKSWRSQLVPNSTEYRGPSVWILKGDAKNDAEA